MVSKPPPSRAPQRTTPDWPSDRRDAAQELFATLSAYIPEFDRALLRKAILQAPLSFPKREDGTVLFGNPLDLAQRLAEFRQEFPTIIAGLLYGSVKSDAAEFETAQERIKHIEQEYGPEIAFIVMDALKVAHMHRPRIGPKLAEKMRVDYDRFKAEKAEAKKQRLKGKKERKVEAALYDRWVALYNEFFDARHFDPRAETIRVAERDILLDGIDIQNPTDMDRARLLESMEVQGPMALKLGLYRAYDRFGDMYLRVHYPTAYKVIARVMKVLRTSLDVMHKGKMRSLSDLLTEAAIEKMKAKGLKPAQSLEALEAGQGDFYIKVREKKPISIWRKLRGDGIDPDDFMEKRGFGAALDEATQDRILIEDVFQRRIYDLFGFRIIFNKDSIRAAAIEQATNKLPPHVMHPVHFTNEQVDRVCCDYMRDALVDSVMVLDENETIYLENPKTKRNAEQIPIEELPYGAFMYEPARQKDYNRNPKPNGFRSLQEGFAVLVRAAGIDRFLLRVEGQFRTIGMHINAEYGPWAHSTFKQESFRNGAAWKAAKPKGVTPIFVFTPQGEILKFEEGATVADAAFRISVELGLGCVGARIKPTYNSWHPIFNPWVDQKAYERIVRIELRPNDKLPDGCEIEIIHDNTLKIGEDRLKDIERHVTTSHAFSMIEKARRPRPRKDTKLGPDGENKL